MFTANKQCQTTQIEPKKTTEPKKIRTPTKDNSDQSNDMDQVHKALDLFIVKNHFFKQNVVSNLSLNEKLGALYMSLNHTDLKNEETRNIIEYQKSLIQNSSFK